jgi:hypothetical protein
VKFVTTIADEAGHRVDAIVTAIAWRTCLFSVAKECAEMKRARGGVWRVVRVEEITTSEGGA